MFPLNCFITFETKRKVDHEFTMDEVIFDEKIMAPSASAALQIPTYEDQRKPDFFILVLGKF